MRKISQSPLRLLFKEKSSEKSASQSCETGMHSVVTRHQFAELAAANCDLRLDLTAKGELIVMPPTGGETGRSNSELNRQIGNWADQHSDLGLVFDSSTGFTLPDGVIRLPDASWVKRDRWESLSVGDLARVFRPCVMTWLLSCDREATVSPILKPK